MNNEQYCLRWNDHRVTLLNNFERLLRNNTSVDCTLAAEGQFLKAHKVVLSACSPYLETLLNQDKEKHPIIFMKDMKFQELKAILLYMYRGEVVIPRDNLAALLHAAESLQIKGLGCGDKPPENETRREALQQPLQQIQKPQKIQHQQHQQQQHQQQLQQLQQQQLQHQQLQHQQLQHQQQQLQQLVQSPRLAPIVRAPSEIAPQIVDLTDERSQTPAPAQIRAAQEAAKRVMPQDTGGRTKRVSFPPNTLERFIPSNIPSTAPRQRAASSPQDGFPLDHTGQVSVVGSFSVPNTAATSPNGAAFATHQSFMVQRQSNDPVARNEYTSPRAVTQPAQHTEVQAPRAPVEQQMAYVPRVRKVVPPQRRVVQSINQNVDKTVPGQPTSPAAHALQQGLPIVGAANVANATAQKVIPTLAPVSASEGIVERTDVNPSAQNVSEQIESERNILPAQDTESSQELLSESGEMRDVDLSKPLSENEAFNAVDNAGPDNAGTDEAGPSDEPPVVRPGRRGRQPGVRLERRFKCTECDRKFGTKSSLEKHRRVHRDDCYKCDVCDKSFLARGALIKHLRQHAPGSTPSAKGQHKCQLCGTMCTDAAELEKHLTNHSLSAADEEETGDV